VVIEEPIIAMTMVIILLLGIGLGYLLKRYQVAAEMKESQANVARLLEEARTKQKEILLEARDQSLKLKAEIEAENRERRQELQRIERRLQAKEENLDRKLENLERRERNIAAKEKEQETIRQNLEELRRQQLKELERIAGMSGEEAQKRLLAMVEDEVRQDANRRIREIEAEARQEADRRAREVVITAVQRYAGESVAEATVSAVTLPSDDVKGRIIGREGRNIRALEKATGVDLIVDDTPEAVILSAFDPVRREVARLALHKLITDGRIHPGRIEEVVAKCKAEVDAAIQEYGEQACIQVGIHNLHPDLVKLLGRLRFRTSYGQNVLDNSLETAHLAGMIAAELGADVKVCKRAGLLHDIGKAVDHEVEGPHAQIGAEIARRLGESPKIVQAIAAHHGEDEEQSLEAIIVQAADAISGARPGARRENLESYLKRLEALENVANSFPGVEKSFAIQAGREVRILVKPEEVDDLGSVRLARDIVKKIEESLEYPGQIKVTVIRETRAVDYAK